MTQIDPQELAKAIIREMQECGQALGIDADMHAEQHKFISELIAERRERTERRKRIQEKIAGSLILSSIIIVIGFIGAGALEWLRKHLN